MTDGAVEQTLVLTISQKKKKMFLANELFPAVIILFTGLMSLQIGTEYLLAYINIFSGAVILLFGIKEWRSLTVPVRHGINLYEVVSGAVMMADSLLMYKPTKGFQPAMIYAVLSIAIMLKGFSIVKPPNIRKLVVSDTGIRLRINPFVRLKIPWDDVRSLSITDGKLVVTSIHGKKSISLRSIGNVHEMDEFLSAECRKRSVAYSN
jgi:hypothetical protein